MKFFTYILTLPFIYFLALLPFRLMYIFSDFLSFVLYRIIGYRKQVVRANLIRTGFGDDPAQCFAIEKAVYKHFCDLYLETFKSLTLSKSQIQKRFVVNNTSLIQDFALQGKSVIMMCGHYASYEWLLSMGYYSRNHFSNLPNDNYRLDVLPGAITDFFNASNDTLQIQFRTQKPADYGSLYLQLVGVPSYPIIVQLTDENENLVRSLPIAAPQRRVVFSNLQPKKYYVRLIVDENNNGKWDSGRFLDRRNPEKIYHHKPLLDVRANWELQEQFSVE